MTAAYLDKTERAAAECRGTRYRLSGWRDGSAPLLIIAGAAPQDQHTGTPGGTSDRPMGGSQAYSSDDIFAACPSEMSAVSSGSANRSSVQIPVS